MIKLVIFDADGMVVKHEMYFSQRFSKEFGVPLEKILPLFENEFQLCLVGKADLKIELQKYLGEWGWTKSIDELLGYWFGHEAEKDERILAEVKNLQSKSVRCFLSTANEKYRTQYLRNIIGLKTYFNDIFSSANLGFLKSQPEFWQAVFEKLNQPNKHEVLDWDNAEENFAAASSIGFMTEFYSGFEFYKQRMKELVDG